MSMNGVHVFPRRVKVDGTNPWQAKGMTKPAMRRSRNLRPASWIPLGLLSTIRPLLDSLQASKTEGPGIPGDCGARNLNVTSSCLTDRVDWAQNLFATKTASDTSVCERKRPERNEKMRPMVIDPFRTGGNKTYAEANGSKQFKVFQAVSR